MIKVLCVTSLMVVSLPVMADDKLSIGSGFDYSSGTYGNATSTQILYVPVIGEWDRDAVTLKVTVPYIAVTGPGGVVQGFGRVSSPSAPGGGGPRLGRNAAGGTTTNSGLGDVVASADYEFYSAGPVSLDAVGKIKFGTASADQGLGTGQNDFAAQLDGYYLLREDLSVFATGGYKLIGAPSGISVNDVGYGTLGADLRLNDTTNVGGMFDLVGKITAAGTDQEELTAYMALKLSSTWKLQGNVGKGFSEGSPDYEFGLTLKGYFPR